MTLADQAGMTVEDFDAACEWVDAYRTKGGLP